MRLNYFNINLFYIRTLKLMTYFSSLVQNQTEKN